MAPFVTKTMNASRVVAEPLSHSPISAACLSLGTIAPGATLHANTYTIRKTRKKLKIHLSLVIKMMQKNFHIIIRVKEQKINT